VRYRRATVLLSQLIGRAAITGRTDTIDPSWFAGRQSGRWVEQTVRSAMPTAAPPTRSTEPARDTAETLRELTQLHQRGVLTTAEFEGLRARVGV
jgi:hypothetical protein